MRHIAIGSIYSLVIHIYLIKMAPHIPILWFCCAFCIAVTTQRGDQSMRILAYKMLGPRYT
jgi:hypothetical protein